jgi:hypothetical protein
METVFNIGLLDTNQFEWRFNLQNKTSKPMQIKGLDLGCHCLSTKRTKWKLSPKETEPLDVQFDLKRYNGKIGRRITLFMADGTKKFITILMELPQ